MTSLRAMGYRSTGAQPKKARTGRLGAGWWPLALSVEEVGAKPGRRQGRSRAHLASRCKAIALCNWKYRTIHPPVLVLVLVLVLVALLCTRRQLGCCIAVQ